MKLFYWSVEYLVSFIEALMSFIFLDTFLKKDDIFKKGIFIVWSIIMAAIIILVGSIDLFSSFGTILLFICMVIMHKLFFKSMLIKIVGIEISYYAVFVVIDFITAALISSVMQTSISDLFNDFSEGRIIASTASKSILTVVCLAFNKQSRSKHSTDKKESLIFSIVSIVILLICTALYFYQADSRSNEMNFIMMILFIVVFVLVMTMYICIVYFFTAQENKKEFELSNQQNNLLARSLKEQENTFSLWRKNIHDYKNVILAMNAMMENQKYDELSKYLTEEKERFIHKAEYIHTGNNIVDTVVNTKFTMAKQGKIVFTVNAVMPNKCVVSDIHLARIIGNLLDNALEASKHETEPFIDMQISSVQGFLIINIKNKCSFIPNRDKTSKSDKIHHGIGLKSVKDTVTEYNGQFDLAFEDNKAIATVMIPNDT